ncbi:hypothetical protein BV898_01143 [Hypsibius exemplaris]|uniref:Uncharacterized protein n=1 Tax=Hypsibius exemplaris TaxID=2072580 RepID=A0A1W0XCD8_HYPEX|nr:hypothetical protein BV898_01143 [Hypsibius exemplaris]
MATVAVHTVVDHPTDGTVVLVLPYFLGQRTMCHPEEQPLQLGTVLLLKEPMLQVSSSTPGTFILRCDSPPMWWYAVCGAARYGQHRMRQILSRGWRWRDRRNGEASRSSGRQQ